jgi:hypothetical protein
MQRYSEKFYYFYITDLYPGCVCFLVSQYVCTVDGILKQEKDSDEKLKLVLL